ncbi:MAG: protein-disulfide reductase DsbD [Campylobacterales bacterium]|nr:protein-disulfide reductase DsbD [Campylobacterales bacterium]
MKKILILLSTVLLYVATAADFLMPDEAFKPYAKVNDEGQIQVGVTIADDIYLYEDKMHVKLINPNDVSIQNIEKPKSVEHHDEQVYLESPEFLVTLAAQEKLSGMVDVSIVVEYQGCSEQGLCYEPSEKEFTLSVDASQFEIASASSPQTQAEVTSSSDDMSETDAIANTIKSSSTLIIILTFFGFGLLLSLTPCVFPMIPIISGVIISQGEGLTTKKAFALSVVYVLAMAIAYTIAGVLAGLFGSNLQAALQTPWVIYSFSAVFVALAMSMFGFYELKVPDSIVAKVSKNSSRSGFVGVAIMGFLSALIVGPCVAAPLAGALVYIGQTGDALLGGAALFSMSIGMGIPLIIVGVSAGRFMPKPGEWMTMVTAIFGIMMLGVAIWMLEKVVSSSTIMLLYALLGIATALYLGAFKSEGHIFKRFVAVSTFIYSTALLIGYLAGSSSMTKPLSFLQGSSVGVLAQAQSHELAFETVTSIDELDVLLEKNKGKKIMLDFAADWCTACKELEEITFSDATVQAKLADYVLIRADVTKNTDKEKALSKKYGVFGPPALIFFDKELQVMKSKTVVGFMEPQPFVEHLNSL